VCVRRLREVLGVALVALSLVSGCGSEGDQPALIDPGSGLSGPQVVNVRPCEDGVVEVCQLMRPEFNGIKSCIDGVRYCDGGVFTPCGQPQDVLPPGVVAEVSEPAQ
jgi:hypothetical protein